MSISLVFLKTFMSPVCHPGLQEMNVLVNTQVGETLQLRDAHTEPMEVKSLGPHLKTS